MMESAEEFADALDACHYTDDDGDQAFELEAAVRLIEARDNATRLAAKLELLEEIRQFVDVCPGTGDKRYAALLDFLQAMALSPPLPTNHGRNDPWLDERDKNGGD